MVQSASLGTKRSRIRIPPSRPMFRLPKVVWCDEVPQWIISSGEAAYHSHSNTIYIRNDMGAATLAHEYGHWLGCLFGWKWLHRWLDGNDG